MAPRDRRRRRFEPAPLVDRLAVPLLGFVIGGMVGFLLADMLSWLLGPPLVASLLPFGATPALLLVALRYPAFVLLGGVVGAIWFWRRAADRPAPRRLEKESRNPVGERRPPAYGPRSQRSPPDMMYPPELLAPMREELTSAGFQELTNAAEVDQWVADKQSGLLVINSVCGCAAGMARPGVRAAVQSANKPARLATVFAGQDKEATMQARGHFSHIAPSSPSMALFKDGEVVDFLPRHRIEGRSAEEVRDDLIAMFDKHFAG